MTKTRLNQTMLAAMLSFFVATGAALAQSPYSVARFVDDKVISNFDITQRIRLLSALGLGNAPRDIALNQLTEDMLKRVAADRGGLTVTEEMRAEGLERFAAGRGLDTAGLLARARSAGVDKSALEMLVDTQILWRQIINIRYRDQATPSDADVETALNASAARAGEEVFLREIAIPFAERGNEGARSLAERIRSDVQSGSSFSSFARRYSRTPSAASGGALGWRSVDRLPPALSGQLLSMLPGDVTEPLEVPAGIILLQLADVRGGGSVDEGEASVSFVRLDLPDGASTAEIIPQLHDCRSAEGMGASFGGASSRIGPVTANSLPTDLSLVVAGLDRGEMAVTRLDGPGESIIMLCSRLAEPDFDNETAIREQLFQRRMADFSEGFLAELRSDVLIRDP